MLNSIVGLLNGGGAGGGGASYESIATVTGNGSSSTLTFSSIPSTYVSLQIRGISRKASVAGLGNLNITFNSDTGTNYSYHLITGTGTAASATGGASNSNIPIFNMMLANTYLADTLAASIIDIHDYASTTKNKTLRAFHGFDTNGTNTQRIHLSSGAWFNTSAITSITLSGTDAFSTSSTFALYGIKGA